MIFYYVDDKTGKDIKLRKGKNPNKPWKTWQYAVDHITIIPCELKFKPKYPVKYITATFDLNNLKRRNR